MRVDNRTRVLAELDWFVLVGGCATTTDDQVGQTRLAEPSTDRETHSTQSTDPDGEDPFGGNDLQDGLMPDVLCMNLQDAQNAIQEHGVFRSRSVDATGADRMQIRDRNWVVVDQSPQMDSRHRVYGSKRVKGRLDIVGSGHRPVPRPGTTCAHSNR
jgi:hypothetical protein